MNRQHSLLDPASSESGLGYTTLRYSYKLERISNKSWFQYRLPATTYSVAYMISSYSEVLPTPYSVWTST